MQSADWGEIHRFYCVGKKSVDCTDSIILATRLLREHQGEALPFSTTPSAFGIHPFINEGEVAMTRIPPYFPFIDEGVASQRLDGVVD